MTYNVTATKGQGYTVDVAVDVFDDAGALILHGETSVVADSEQQAKDYAEQVYLPDLRRNFRELSGLVLISEQPLETIAPSDGGVADVVPTAEEAV
jgi:hypothetical protein